MQKIISFPCISEPSNLKLHYRTTSTQSNDNFLQEIFLRFPPKISQLIGRMLDEISVKILLDLLEES